MIRQKKARDKTQRSKSQRRLNKKFTKFFDVTNGDDLIDLVVEVAEAKAYKYKKSDEYFMVEVVVENKGFETKIWVTVAKNPNAEARWVSFENLSGSKELFKWAFKLFKKYLKRRFKYAAEQ